MVDRSSVLTRLAGGEMVAAVCSLGTAPIVCESQDDGKGEK